MLLATFYKNSYYCTLVCGKNTNYTKCQIHICYMQGLVCGIEIAHSSGSYDGSIETSLLGKFWKKNWTTNKMPVVKTKYGRCHKTKLNSAAYMTCTVFDLISGLFAYVIFGKKKSPNYRVFPRNNKVWALGPMSIKFDGPFL